MHRNEYRIYQQLLLSLYAWPNIIFFYLNVPFLIERKLKRKIQAKILVPTLGVSNKNKATSTSVRQLRMVQIHINRTKDTQPLKLLEFQGTFEQHTDVPDNPCIGNITFNNQVRY
jgi:hypothetical protein